ncbi:MAG: hypothetical protein ACE5LF_02260 [Alphaproteobacteria bacterium]
MFKAVLYIILAVYIVVAFTYTAYLFWIGWRGKYFAEFLATALERGLLWPIELVQRLM